jgi:DNA-binding CsgD family transcriptional regulator
MWIAHILKELDDRAELGAILDRLDALERDVGVTLYDPYIRALRGWLALNEDDSGRAVRLAQEAAEMPGGAVQRAQALIWAAEVELLAGEHDRARAHASQVVDVGRAGFAFYLCCGLLLQSRLTRAAGQPVAAARLAHEALDIAHRVEARCRVIDALELLGGISGDLELPEEAARLLGAARAEREAIGYRSGITHADAELVRLRARLGASALERAYADGRSLPLVDALAYSRRGRGERRRPAAGWESLTPTEHQVVALLCQGCTNAQIGERLFVSPRTIQAHLTRIYTKLGVTSRTELAAKAAARTP